MRTIPSIAAGLLISCATWVSTASEAQLPPTLQPQARVAIAALGESSGIIASRRHAGVFWSHNDSGDGARLFAFRDREAFTSVVKNSLFVGETENVGNPHTPEEKAPGRHSPARLAGTEPPEIAHRPACEC